MKKGIDIAQWNEVTDYAAVASQVSFAILKIINKNNTEDSRFSTHLNGCRANNIPVIGVYNYSYAESIDKAITDSNAVIAVLKKHNLNATVWLDIEEQAIAKRIGARLIDLILAYRDNIVAAGYGFGVYTGLSYYNSYIKKYESRLGGIPMWIARYPSSAAMTIDNNPSESKKPDVLNMIAWQYSSKGQIVGIKGNTDLNILYADTIIPAPVNNESSAPVSDGNYYPTYAGTSSSIATALKSLGVDSSYDNRAKIAAANGISGYSGTAAQNTQMLSLLKQGKLKVAGNAPAASSDDYYPRYKGVTNTSLVSGLAGVGEKDTSFAHRKKIAEANGIAGYTGTASQNTQLLTLLKQGKLKKG